VLAELQCASIVGVEGAPVRVEVDVAFGLPALTIVGLAGSQVQEARERVRSAVRNSGFELPARRITVNLSPADVPKDGTGYDLAIAIGILAASGQLRDTARLRTTGLIGELALDGGLRPVPGVLALTAALRDGGCSDVILPSAAAGEASIVRGLRIHGAASLGDAVAHVAGTRVIPPFSGAPTAAAPRLYDGPDLADVEGQPLARRALEIALAGRHNLVLCGPPGVGKTLLLQCAGRLLPPLGDEEAVEVSRIYSVAGMLDRGAPLVRERPLRAPHHTVSTQALVGGGTRVRPGEVSLAHRGALVLDEMLQFRADALEALRQPMEAGSVTIARVDGALSLPASFSLLAAFNPCPCGWRGARRRACTCDDALARRYAARLSGPLRDRIDLWVRMGEPIVGRGREGVESSAPVAERIVAARQRQLRRQGAMNGDLAPGDLDAVHGLPPTAMSHLASRGRAFGLSPRRLHRAARVARTIADLAGNGSVSREHLDEALAYRSQAQP